MRFKERGSLNKTLLVLYIFLAILTPLSVVFVSMIGENNFHDSKFLAGAFRLMFFFIAIPVFISYIVNIVKYKFPIKNIAALLMISSFFVFIIYTIITSPDQLLESMEYGGLIFYCGLNIIFLIGIFHRIFFQMPKDRLLFSLIMFPIVLIIFFYPAGYIFTYLITSTINSSSSLQAILELIFSLLLVIGFHFPILRNMEKEGII
jgi:hypothetical protein